VLPLLFALAAGDLVDDVADVLELVGLCALCSAVLDFSERQGPAGTLRATAQISHRPLLPVWKRP
jgi:hypothetical protein